MIGSVIAVKLVPRFDPFRLGAVALVALTLPLFLLVLELPAWGVAGGPLRLLDLRPARERAADRA